MPNEYRDVIFLCRGLFMHLCTRACRQVLLGITNTNRFKITYILAMQIVQLVQVIWHKVFLIPFGIKPLKVLKQSAVLSI